MELEASILLELGVLLLVLTTMSGLAWRIGFSAAPLFLVAGLAAGEGGLVPFTHSFDFLEVAGGIGVLLLLLTLGLEFSAAEFTATMKRHAPTGVIDFVLNAPPGFIAGLMLGLDWRASLALAGITYISSSGIIARLLSDLGRLGNRETPAVLSVLVLEDVAMAAYLPLLGAVLVGGHLVAGVLGSIVAVLITLSVIWLTQRTEKAANWLFTHDDEEQVLFRVLGITFAVAGLAELAGISAAVGAFLVGLAIPSPAAERVREILRPLRNLFAALFFFVFGLGIDPGELGPALPAAFALAFVTIFTKLGTGWFAAGREGASVRGKLRAGTALIARGEFSVVIAGLAVAAGYVALGPVASAYVLIVAVVGPVLARSSDWLAAVFLKQPKPKPKREPGTDHQKQDSVDANE
ncbi:MAG: cation:proton antiporter [Actinomycetia bacterium]|nr:cation:proton antiporter [Actinomycetes bacterium]